MAVGWAAGLLGWRPVRSGPAEPPAARLVQLGWGHALTHPRAGGESSVLVTPAEPCWG